MATKHTISQAKYDKEHRRTYGLRLHNELDKDIIEKLASVPSMQGYIKSLIRADITSTGSVPESAPVTSAENKMMEDKKMKKSEAIKKYQPEIMETMSEKYRNVLESEGRLQYRIYVWSDGEIECLEGPQGDNSYLKAKDSEPRTLFYVDTVSAPGFSIWDAAGESAPENEQEAEEMAKSVIDSCMEEYTDTLPDMVDALIREAEDEEAYEESRW